MSEHVAQTNCISFADLTKRWRSEEILLRLINSGELSAYIILDAFGNTFEVKPLEGNSFRSDGEWLYKMVASSVDYWLPDERKNVIQITKLCFKITDISAVEREKSFMLGVESVAEPCQEECARLRKEAEELKRRIQELESLEDVTGRKKLTYLKIIRRFFDCQSQGDLEAVKKALSDAKNSHTENELFGMHESTILIVWRELQKLS